MVQKKDNDHEVIGSYDLVIDCRRMGDLTYKSWVLIKRRISTYQEILIEFCIKYQNPAFIVKNKNMIHDKY